jgi:hypothetical protein
MLPLGLILRERINNNEKNENLQEKKSPEIIGALRCLFPLIT